MRKRLAAALIAALCLVATPADASPAEEYTRPHFGDGNLPRGCEHESFINYESNVCHRMRTGLNALDSPQVDVLVMVPASPTAERDVRIMRQAIEMWEAGIHNLAPQMGLQWLARGMQFHITVDVVDLADSGNGGEFTTYPIVDPEIVVIATNPVGAIGIGIDPAATFGSIGEIFGTPAVGELPCTGLANPFDFDAWDALPGFDRHHEERMGTFVEDCGGAGGNICFAVNTARDPAPPETVGRASLFDLVTHEVGHCLTLGHVGDGAEGPWGKVPTNDIMAYSKDPAGLNKCVSTLDVETVATRMSGYLDVNDDRKVNAADRLLTNDQKGQGGNAFQVQHPRDHWYASDTGEPTDCPQPDLGLVPGRRTNWNPEPVSTKEPVLTVNQPTDGATSADGAFVVAGTVAHLSKSRPKSPTVHFDDADNDARSPFTEITALDVEATPSTVEATMHLAQLPPTSATSASGAAYSITINTRRFDSFVRAQPLDGGPLTWDAGGATYMPRGTSTWDAAANTVTFRIPRDYLKAASIESPYKVSSRSAVGVLGSRAADDRAPDDHRTVGVADVGVAPSSRAAAVPSHPASSAGTVTFEHPGGNEFQPRNTTLGLGTIPLYGQPQSHRYALDVPKTSDVTLTLNWTGSDGFVDLDLYTEGGGADDVEPTSDRPEVATLSDVRGHLDIVVDPFFVGEPDVTYTLTALITPKAVADADGDAVPDDDDVCRTIAGDGADGCPIKPVEFVVLYVDGTKTATQVVDTTNGTDAFAIVVRVGRGSHKVTLEWESFGRVLTSKSLYIGRR